MRCTLDYFKKTVSAAEPDLYFIEEDLNTKGDKAVYAVKGVQFLWDKFIFIEKAQRSEYVYLGDSVVKDRKNLFDFEWKDPPSVSKCVCGASAIGSNRHVSWCEIKENT